MRIICCVLLLTAARYGACSTSESFEEEAGYDCRPNQPCWPGREEWDKLNKTIGGNLRNTVPLAASCYLDSGFYNPDSCHETAEDYKNSTRRSDVYGASEILNWETCHKNGCTLQSVLPQLPPLFDWCALGRLSSVYVNASKPDHVSETIKFARQHNIRLSIKNTGHDYFGRDTAPNSLAIWTHHMTNMTYHATFKGFQCSSADGKDIGEIGAGVQASEAYAFFEKHGMNVPGGNEGTVGLAGGFGQGGGHGVFGPSYGLMVDNAVEFDVVTADGKQHTINACNEPELFWAMRGGGGGTFAVLTAYRFQLHPAQPINLYTLRAEFPPLQAEQALRDFLAIHADNQTTWSDNRIAGHAYYFPTKIEMYLVLPGGDEAVFRNLTSAYQTYAANYPGLNILENRYSRFAEYSGLLRITQSIADRLTPSGFYEVLAGRLLPRNLFDPSKRDSLIDAVLSGIKSSDNIIARAANIPTQIIMTTPANRPDGEGTSVHPAWRHALWHLVYSGGWTDGIPSASQDHIVKHLLDAVEPVKSLTPGGGCYVNEGHYLEPDWKQTFFGSNYDKLLEIKKRYDPTHLFDCWKCVGWRGDSE
ncbi:hypothetical protein BDV24DRAFT_168965 [Aspergillus arachidicola]|uniref:FAD-binding PCMH-type domain-containing protein n=1 Tax=Aspergillus arachidicola TaxID=656916 RepID=A0A5N6XVZ7_9EURO|nr:hypothetical protein BDV24DRAFT_168965 [Aspergillus arachidicola]